MGRSWTQADLEMLFEGTAPKLWTLRNKSTPRPRLSKTIKMAISLIKELAKFSGCPLVYPAEGSIGISKAEEALQFGSSPE